MKIKVIDCKYLFIDSIIDGIKRNIKAYHQGFMLVDDTLYIPYYQVLQRKYSLPKQYETILIDLSDVIDFDDLATYFYAVTTLDIDDVIDLYNDWLNNEFDTLIDTVDEIARSKYELGFNDGYEGDSLNE